MFSRIVCLANDQLLARYLQRALPNDDVSWLSFDRHASVDIARYIARTSPDVVVLWGEHWASTYSSGAHHGGEKTVIVELEYIAKACEKRASGMVFISSGAVFSGSPHSKGTEIESPVPTSELEKKLARAEATVHEVVPKSIVVRTSWLFCRRAQLASSAQILQDCRRPVLGNPTYVPDFVDALALLMFSEQVGTYHLVGAGSATLTEFCSRLMETIPPHTALNDVFPIDLSQPDLLSGGATIENKVAATNLDISLRHWQSALEEYVEDCVRTVG